MEQFKKGAERLLRPPVWVVFLSCLSFPGLVWVFGMGYEGRWFAYPIFTLSAYALTVAGIRLIPWLIRWLKNRKRKDSVGKASEEAVHSFARALYQNLAISLGYAVFNLVSAVNQDSAWLASNGFYYLVQTLMYGVLLFYQRRLEKRYAPCLAWKGYTVIGGWLFVLNLTMTGIVFQMIWRGEGSRYPGFVVLGVAAFTFYKLIASIVALTHGRRDNAPVRGAMNNMDHTSALMSLFSLQTALFSTYGQDFDQQRLMNILTGAAVCLMTVLGAGGMVLHGRKRMKETRGE